MAGLDIAAADHIMKRLYPRKRVVELTLENNTMLDMLPKDESHEGSIAVIPMVYKGGQGHGITLAGAQANVTSTGGVKAHYDTGTYITSSDVAHKTMKAARSDRGSFARDREIETSEAIRQHGNDLEMQLWGDGGGAIALAASYSAPTITLTNKADAYKFEVGMRLQASTASGAGSSDALLDSGNVGVVESVNYTAGTVTLVADTISGLGNHYLFRANAFAGAVSQVDIMKGWQAHNPSAVPTTSLHNVDRTLSPRLYGMIPDSTTISGNYERRFKAAASWFFSRFQSRPMKFFVNPDHWVPLTDEMEAMGYRIIDVKNDRGVFGYKGVDFRTPYGDAQVVTAPFAPLGRCHAVDFNHAKLLSMGGVCDLVNDDGLMFSRKATTMDFETRYTTYAELCVDKPCAHGSFALPSLS